MQSKLDVKKKTTNYLQAFECNSKVDNRNCDANSRQKVRVSLACGHVQSEIVVITDL